MQYYKRIITLSVLLLITCVVSCGNDRATTIELSATTNTPQPAEPSPTATVPPTQIPTQLPTDAPITEPTPTPTPTATLTPTETPTPTATPEPINTELDQEKLITSLLTINDMPTGWTIGEAPEFNPRTPGGTYTFACKELPARSIGNISVEFQKSALGPFLQETITVYENRRDAKDALADNITAANECGEWTDDQGNTTVLSPLSFPNLGDETFAIRMVGENYEGDRISVRKGNVLVTIFNWAFPIGVDSELTEEMVILALERFEENN